MTKKICPEDVEEPFDPDRWPSEQDLRRTAVEWYGETAFGTRWQTPMADALSKHTGRNITPAQVNHWMKGVRPVPRSIHESLTTLLPKLIAGLRERADELEGVHRRRVEALAEEAAAAAAVTKAQD